MNKHYIAPWGKDEGVALQAYRTFKYAQEVMVAGDTLVIHPGSYTLSEPFNPPSGCTIEALDRRTAILSGLNIRVPEVLWVQESKEKVWSCTWQPEWTVGCFSEKEKTRINKGETATYRELIVFEGDPVPYRQTFNGPSLLQPGTFYLDADKYHQKPSVLYICPRDNQDPADRARMSTLPGLINTIDGYAPESNLTIKGLVLQYAACPYGDSILNTAPGKGGGTLVEDCEICWSAAGGITIEGVGCITRDCDVHHNGQGDLSGWRSLGCLIEKNRTWGSNWKNFRKEHNAGNKFAGIKDCVFKHNTFGPTSHQHDGLWFDVLCSKNQIIANRIMGVYRAGIFIEWSYDNLIANNIITGVRGEGEQACGGIYLKEANYNRVYHNTIIDCSRGMRIRTGAARPNEDGVPLETKYNEIFNNLVIGKEPEILWQVEDRESNSTKGNIFAFEDDLLTEDFRPQRPSLMFEAVTTSLERDYYDRPRFSSIKSAVGAVEGWVDPIEYKLEIERLQEEVESFERIQAAVQVLKEAFL